MTPSAVRLALALAAVLALQGAASASRLAEEGLHACYGASSVSGPQREQRLRDGLSLGERALAADPADARAHLAVFCNLGRLTQDEGVGLSAMATVRRLTRTIEDAARLAPDDPEILAARGAFLLELPRMLGGDPTAGESMLRRSLAMAPSNCEAAARLARALEASGRGDEAAALAGGC